MSDFGNINQFRKTTQLRKINEDPTYLSFFFLFNFYDRENSPLLSGAAEDYLRNVIGDNERADTLKRFIKLLQRINVELPWFWQSITGLENTRKYGDMSEPWRGSEKPKLEIECLENIELTSFALIDLYKKATYDFNRWISVIPKNLCYFEMTIFVTEVRTFQQNAADALKDSKGKFGAFDESQVSEGLKKFNDIASSMSVDTKPIIATKLNHCTFDIESTNELFSNLSKNPEIAKSNINIFWNSSEELKVLYGSNLGAGINTENQSLIQSGLGNNLNDLSPNNPNDPINRLNRRLTNSIEGIGANVANIFNGLPGSNKDGLGNVYGSTFTGQIAQLVNRGIDAVTARLFLGNVYGANTASNLQDAIRAGSINAIFNAAGQLVNRNTTDETSGPISPKRIYPEITSDITEGPINQRVYQPVVDSTPDGNLNQNVYE